MSMPAPCRVWTDVISPNMGMAFLITAPITSLVIDLAIEVMHLEAANLTAMWEWQTHLKMEGRRVSSFGFNALIHRSNGTYHLQIRNDIMK